MSRRAQHYALLLGSLLIAAVWSGFLAASQVAGRATIFDRIEAPLADLRLLIAGPRDPSSDVVIVAIDDETVRASGRFPLPRDRLAELVDVITRAGARVLGVDILLVQEGAEAGDQALAAALGRSHAVLAAAARFQREGRPSSASAATPPVASSALWPIARLRDKSLTGFVNVTTDWAGTPRHVPLVILLAGEPHGSFPLQVASAAARDDAELGVDQVKIGGVVSRLDVGAHLPLRFYGPRGSIGTIGASDLIRDPSLSSELKGRIVVLGVTALGSGDTFTTPFDSVLPGVEVLATAVSHLLQGDGLRRDSTVRRVDAAAIVLLPALVLVLMSLGSTSMAVALVAVTVLAWAGAATMAFDRGVWLNMALPLAAMLPPALLYGIARRWIEQRAAQGLARSRRILRQLQDPRLADLLESQPGFLAEPHRQEAAIVFVDLTGFTPASERIGPEASEALLREFHRLVDEDVSRKGGLVMAHLGDGAMAVFGVPQPGEDDARAALACVLDLARRLEQWLARYPYRLGVKLGAHAGPVIVSRLGGDSHQHITATGDSVNVASRLQEVAASHGALAACSEELLSRVKGPASQESGFGPPMQVDIRGRTSPLAVRLWPGPAAAGARAAAPSER